MATWKLSPSDLTFLWDECKRCFYLKVVHGFGRPRAPFPRIFGKIDRLMNAYFQAKPSSEISVELPAGRIEYGERWVTSERIALSGHECFIRGRFDTVLAFSDGSYGVVDFKTTQPSQSHVPFYSRQLHAYAYALEHPASGGFQLHPITHLGLFCVDPSAMERLPDGQIAYLGEPTWLEIPKDEQQFLGFIGDVMTLLAQADPPPANPECGYCRYRDQARGNVW